MNQLSGQFAQYNGPQVWKQVVENDILWFEMGQDLDNQEAPSHQEFQGVPPEGSLYSKGYYTAFEMD